jgi:outer membrane lipoprotein-sorting protein
MHQTTHRTQWTNRRTLADWLKRQRRTLMSLLMAVALLPTAPAVLGQATQPAWQQGDQPQTAEQWLTQIEERADEIDTLQARLRYDRVKGLLGAKQSRFGTLKYAAGPPVRFAVHFTKLLEGRAAREQNRHYIFDGRWLAEKRVDEKIFVRRELVPAGQKRNLLQMDGDGPFVLPLNQDKQHVLKRFNVKVVPSQSDDPQNTVHLRLTPKEGREIDFSRVDLWYDKQTLLPKRATTVKKEGGAENKSVVTLLDVQKNVDFAQGAFDTAPPQGPGWEVQVKRLKDRQQQAQQQPQ